MRSQQTVLKIYNVAHIVCKVLTIVLFVFAGITIASGLMTIMISSMEGVNEIIADTLITIGYELTAFEVGIMTIAEGIVMIAEGIVFKSARDYFKGGLADGTPFTFKGADDLKSLGI